MTIPPQNYSPLTTKKDNNFYIKHDEFKNASFIRHKLFFNKYADLPLELYIVKDSNLRITFTYRGSDWIFFDQAILLSSTDRMEFSFKSYDKTTNVGYGGAVFESIDLYLSDQDSQKLLNILNASGDHKVRLTGKYYRDYILNKNKINALKEILDYYFGNS